MLTSIPKVLEKGMLSMVFYGSDVTAQMQVLRTSTCLRGKKKKLVIATISTFLRDNQVHRCKNIAFNRGK